MARQVVILGSTGSIGTQALEVIEEHADKFQVEVLTANGNADLLIEQAIKFKPNVVVIADEAKYKKVGAEYEITLKTTSEKFRSDALGKETQVPIADYIDIDIF